MSMILELQTLGDATIGRILADPRLVWLVVAPEDPDLHLSEIGKGAAPVSGGFLARLLGRSAPQRPTSVPDVQLGEGAGSRSDIDKSWHGIHYLLTGTAWEGDMPLCFLLKGGHEVGDIDVGYGPARAFDSGEVARIHSALAELSDEILRERFDPDDMTAKGIYPSIWERAPGEDDALGYLMAHVQELRTFIKGAAERRMGMLVFLT